jgi:hypothetical protein
VAEGFDATKLLKRLSDVAKGAKAGRNRGLMLAGRHVLNVSNSRVPFDEGDLARSGAVVQDETTGLTAVTYNEPYAVRQHEDMGLRHKAGREAKFLENAMNTERPKLLEIVAAQVRKDMGL